MFTWVPAYLSTVLNYSPTATGWMFMVFTGMNIPIVLGGSALSQWLMKRGVSSVCARVWLSCSFVLLGGLSILASIYLAQDPLMKVILLAIGCNLPQLTFVLSSTIVAEIVPSMQRSGILAINSALATTGGLIAPALTGRFIQNAVSPAVGYDQGFVVSACLAVGMAILGFLIINPATSRRRFSAASVAIGARAPSAAS
jgi:sugar phosphate permease